MAETIITEIYGYRCESCGAKEQDVFKVTADHKKVVCMGCGTSAPYLFDPKLTANVEKVHRLLDAFQAFVNMTCEVGKAWEKVEAFDVLTETSPKDFPNWDEFINDMIAWRDRAAQAAGMDIPDLVSRATAVIDPSARDLIRRVIKVFSNPKVIDCFVDGLEDAQYEALRNLNTWLGDTEG